MLSSRGGPGKPVKQLASKHELRAEIERQIREFLQDGGTVEEVARGISGRDSLHGVPGGFHGFTPRPREERTYVPEVVAAIEARRRKSTEKPQQKRSRSRLVRKAVYDDFGEPVRWEWAEEDMNPSH